MLRIFLRLVLVLVALAFLYVGFNTPLTSRVKELSSDELRRYTSYLDATPSEPLQFVADKFDRYDLVLLGEMHWKKQDLDFVNQLIPYLYRTKGIRIFAWEFGASELQGEADALVNAPVFDRKRAVAFMRRSYFEWNFEEYLDIIKTIWEINRTIPAGQEKFRFLQLRSVYNPRKLHSPDPAVRRQEGALYAYDEKMGQIVEREVLAKHQKALWYSGLHHAFTKYKQPMFLFMKGFHIRGGEYLYQRYPEQMYLAQLYMPFATRLLFPKLLAPSVFGELTYVYPFRGAIEQIYREHKRPFAVDAKTSIFGDLKDNQSYYSLDRWSALTLREMCDGYIVLSSIDDMEPVGLVPDWVTDRADFEEVKSLLVPEDAARIGDVPALLAYIERQSDRSQIKQMRNLGK